MPSPSVKKSPAKKSPTKKSPAKKSPAKKTMSKNAKVAAGVAAALALAGAAGYGAYKVKQRRDLQSEKAMKHDSVMDYSKSSVMRIISTIKQKANEARQRIIERFKKNTITMAKAEEDMKQVAKQEEKAIKQVREVVPEAVYF